MVFHMLMYHLGHLVIDRCHDLIEHLNDCHFNAEIMEVLSHLDTDESAADDNSLLDLFLFNKRLDLIDIRNRPKREDIWGLNSRNRWFQRNGSR